MAAAFTCGTAVTLCVPPPGVHSPTTVIHVLDFGTNGASTTVTFVAVAASAQQVCACRVSYQPPSGAADTNPVSDTGFPARVRPSSHTARTAKSDRAITEGSPGGSGGRAESAGGAAVVKAGREIW